MNCGVSSRSGRACNSNRVGPTTFRADTRGEPMRSPGWKKRLLRAPVAALFLLLLLTFTVPAMADLPWEPAEEGASGLHAQCWSLGASVGQVEGLSGGLSTLAGPDNGVIILEVTQNNYLTPYVSEEEQISLFMVNNFTLLQGSYGMRWSTVPFPKVFLRPWVGAYVTLNLLEDLRENDPLSEEEEFDGIGIGLAAAMGVTMRLGGSAAVEVAVKGDQIFTAGWLDTGEFYKDEFRIRGAYLRLLYFFKD